MKPTNLKDIEALRDKGALFVVSHSGGKDSQAMYLLVTSIVPHDQIKVIHAPLGKVEWKGVIKHIEDTINHPLHFSKAIWKDGSDKDLFGQIRDRGRFPSKGQPFCTSGLKIGPIEKVIKRWAKETGAPIVVNCTGIRAEESPNRANMVPFQFMPKKSLKRGGRDWYDWKPIFNWTTEEVFKYIEEKGQKPHFAYALGMSRLSCCVCILAKEEDLRISAQHNPELFLEYMDLEKEIGHTMKFVKKKQIALNDFIGLTREEIEGYITNPQ